MKSLSYALLVLLIGFPQSPAAYAGRYVDIDHGYGLSTYRPPYLDNNHGRLVPYGIKKGRHHKPRKHGRGYSKRGIHSRSHSHGRSRFEPEFRYRDRDSRFRYSLHPFNKHYRGRHRDDGGRLSIRIGGTYDRGEVIYFNFPVSPRHRY